MSFSTANTSNLRFLYCDSTLEKNTQWEKFNKALETKFDETIETTLQRKYDKYFCTLFNEMIEAFDCNKWTNYSYYDNKLEATIFTIFRVQKQRDPELANFMISISSKLAHSYRHEILRESDESCIKLAQKHFLQIENCFQEYINITDPEDFGADLTPIIEDLTNLIIKSIDPNPKLEIENRINDYINERKGRLIRSSNFSREKFLRNFKEELKEPNVDLEGLIDKISNRVLFRNDWFFWLGVEEQQSSLSQMKSSLSVNNPFIKGLEIYKNNNTSNNTFDTKFDVFNNPFFTAFCCHHISMNETTEDILLLLMRLHITQVANQPNGIAGEINKISLKVIKRLNTSMADRLNQNIVILSNRLHQLRSRMYAEIEAERERREYWSQNGISAGNA